MLEKILYDLRKTYKPGDRVELVKMNDVQTLPIGTLAGTLKRIMMVHTHSSFTVEQHFI